MGGFGIRVNTVSPGPTYTEVQRDTVSSDQKTAMLAQQNLHREAHPDDIVGAVKFLLSDASGFITGQTLHVNGGLVHDNYVESGNPKNDVKMMRCEKVRVRGDAGDEKPKEQP